ncbi:taste receptor type 2 member 40-like [Zootoca vivipara]|uniref:taste receptor type 2 member 40-like n=1 Tax=Zootoca vivipara TaxID=8524 RepID=UPI001592A42B|nr:taste receptor type 2 member 40-like [Zootoca vivipara]
MLSSKIIAFLVAAIDWVLGGLISNGFIVAVMVTEWAQCKSLATCEQLLLSLGTSNIFATACEIAVITNFFITNSSNGLVFQTFYFFATFVSYTRFCFTAWLCVFYCIKIVNSTHTFFLWCKLRISQLLPWLLVGSQVFSFFVSLITIPHISFQLQSNIATNTSNVTQGKKATQPPHSLQAFFLITATGCPLLVVLLCSIVIVASLCTHVCKMTGKGASLRSLQTKAHIRAARTVLSLLILYISFYVAHSIIVLENIERITSVYSVCLAVILMYSPAQGAILLLANPKLKQAAIQMLPKT